MVGVLGVKRDRNAGGLVRWGLSVFLLGSRLIVRVLGVASCGGCGCSFLLPNHLFMPAFPSQPPSSYPLVFPVSLPRLDVSLQGMPLGDSVERPSTIPLR
jgi:hypothetical protein